MKTISLISLHTPTKENTRGASALPYHLIEYRPKNLIIEVYSFNINNISPSEIQNIERQLNIRINILPYNLSSKLLRSKYLGWLRVLRQFPNLHQLKLSKVIVQKIIDGSDNVWIYGEDIAHLAELFNDRFKCIVTTPDCEALYYDRVLSMPSKIKGLRSILRYAKAYSQYLNVARNLPIKNVCYHLVGTEDKEFLQSINSEIKATYLPHPHYEGIENRIIRFNQPKIRLLISGRYDFYCKEGIEDAIQAISSNKELSDKYIISFQGKGWEKCVEMMTECGFDVRTIGYVDSYKEELCNHDILLTAITLGTGTKGKVLDAFTNGLLVVGTLRSIENIKVEKNRDFFFYKNGYQLINILQYIPDHIDECEKIARNGREAVLINHNISLIADSFYKLFS